MKKLFAALTAGLFACALASPVMAQDKKQEQVHKGTAEQGTVQKKDQKAKKDQKKDGSGGKAKQGAAAQ